MPLLTNRRTGGAKVWIIKNQFGRRNLSPYARAELALKLEDVYAAKGKARMSAGGGDQKSDAARSGCLILDNPINETPVDTLQEVAKDAGVSRANIAKVKVIASKADAETKKRLREGKTTVSKEYKAIKEAEKTKARAEREETAVAGK